MLHGVCWKYRPMLCMLRPSHCLLLVNFSIFSHVAFVSVSNIYAVGFTKVMECGGMTFITDLLVRKLLVEHRHDLDVKGKQMKLRMWMQSPFVRDLVLAEFQLNILLLNLVCTIIQRC
jgi:hypothetical protein